MLQTARLFLYAAVMEVFIHGIQSGKQGRYSPVICGAIVLPAILQWRRVDLLRQLLLLPHDHFLQYIVCAKKILAVFLLTFKSRH